MTRAWPVSLRCSKWLLFLLPLIFLLPLPALYLLAGLAGNAPQPAAGPLSTRIHCSQGRLLAAYTASDGQWRLETQGSHPLFDAAVIAIEDHRWKQHQGIDWWAVAAAAGGRFLGQGRRGASTIAMQVARLRYRIPRSWRGKWQQAILALQLRRQLSPRELLQEWQQRASYGGNLIGAEAAAWRWFDKPLAECSLGEVALLAGLPQGPEALRPDRFPAAAGQRRARVLRRMLELELITAADAARAHRQALPTAWHPLPKAAGAGPALLAEARRYGGGDLDSSIDRAWQEQVWSLLPAWRQQQQADAAAVLVIRVADGAILALASDAPQAPWLDLSRQPRSPGSTLKPLIYTEALAQGWLDLDAPLDPALADQAWQWQGWAPQNADQGFSQGISAADALASSRNIPALRILERAGVARVHGLAQSLGLSRAEAAGRRSGLALAVGGFEVTMRELGHCYAALARDGLLLPAPGLIAPRLGDSPQQAPVERRVLPRGVALRVLAACAQPARTAALVAAAAELAPAWKTGTSSDHRDAWCVALTPQTVVVVWVGQLQGAGQSHLSGSRAAAPLALELLSRMEPPGPCFTDWAAEQEPEQLRPLPRPLQQVDSRPLILYPRDQDQILAQQDIPLQAGRGQPPYHWFANDQYLGSGQRLSWTSQAGSQRIRLVDSQGASQEIQVLVRRW